MKVSELKDFERPFNADNDLYVKLTQISIGYSAAAPVLMINSGIDWDSGRTFIYPEEPLVSWDYILKYIPDAKEIIREEQRRRSKEAVERGRQKRANKNGEQNG